MTTHRAVLEELPCDGCGGAHSNFVARCLVSGVDVLGPWARWKRERDIRDLREEWYCPISGALVKLDTVCHARHEAA